MIALKCIILILFIRKVCSETNEENADTILKQYTVLEEISGFFKVLRKFSENFETFKIRIKNAYVKFINGAFNIKNEEETDTVPYTEDEFTKESNMLTYQLIVYHGYRVQSHVVQTEDGYLIRIFRLLSRFEDSTKRNRTVILLHGLMSNSDNWLLLGPNMALPYMLVQAGCDVWLPNFRGNKYANTHISKLKNTTEFWNFSFHEMGIYDLKSSIDYVNAVKAGTSNITLIGHSMGATAILVLLSTQPQYNHMMNSAVLLAPLAFMYKIKGPLKYIANMYAAKKFESLFFFGNKKFVDHNFPPEVVKQYCRGDNVSCWNTLLLIANGGKRIQNQNLSRNVIGHTPDMTSARNIYHYIQLVNSGRFQNLDYGEDLNFNIYGDKKPSVYKLQDVTLPMFVFSSLDDFLATMPNVINLVIALQNVVGNYIIQGKEFTHTDFVWGEEAPNILFKHIIAIVRGKYNNTMKEIIHL